MRPDEILKSNIDDAITTLNRINGDGKLDYADYEDMFDAISTITDGVDFLAASPWHRVEEPPKKERRYLVWEVSGFAYCDTWLDGEWKVASSVPGTIISHWMPIEPPQEET